MTVQLVVPMTLDHLGRFVTVEQDSTDDIVQSVRTVLLTVPDTRLTDPEYGVDLEFTRSADLDDLAEEVGRFEPRATPAEVETVIDSVGYGDVVVRVHA